MVLSLGKTALANSFLRDPSEFAEEPTYPLAIYFCHDCSLVQLRDIIDPEVLFRHYLYVTGTSETMAQHFQSYAEEVVEFAQLPAGSLVAEAASNDGSLLRHFQNHKMQVLGIEPAENIATMAEQAGIRTVKDFFNKDTGIALRKKYGQAACVCGNNVLAHVDHTVQFLSGFYEFCKPDGLAVVEVPYLANLLAGLEYDTIYHEHLCYFSVTSLARLFALCGLSIVRAQLTPVHGGSVRIYARPREVTPDHSEKVRQMIEREKEEGLSSIDSFHEFAKRVEENRSKAQSLLRQLHREGKQLAAYGAPAKGNTFLNYCGIGPELIEFTVDKNPLKTGKYLPGTHIPVLHPDELQARAPDYTLILAWNFAEEIMRQQADYVANGGKFIIPLPEPRII